ncbi:MAG: IS110 family transposase [Gammaproteobacteria bacterium]|nr:IS110 family transposase [Gammaproteobacteria bacterium]
MKACYSAGIDLHSNNNVICIIDHTGKIEFRHRLANDLQLILSVLEQYRDHLSGVVVESTFNWYWLVDGLMDAGYYVELANPAAMKQYEGLKYTDDHSDAAWLANCFRLGLLKKAKGYIYPREVRQVRDLLRKRLQLVHQRTANILSIQNLTARNTGGSINSREVKQLTEERIYQMFPEVNLAMAAIANLHVMQTLNSEVKILEQEVNKQVISDNQYEILMGVSGIGKILGMTIHLETGDINRFAHVGNYSSYCRCVESRRTSNDKVKGRGNRKNGNKYLAWAFMEAAHFAIRHHDLVQSYYHRKLTKCKKIVALKTVSHKLARACYWVMKNREPYDINRAFG